jgi:diketogulonate reductase-like aldo/keto reductase
MSNRFWSRRDLIKVATAVGLAPVASVVGDEVMRTRSIPVSDEPLPVIGLGTYNVFDVQGTPTEIAERREIIDLFTGKGASLIDSSPMYNRSEKIIGDVLRASSKREQLFIATKVWIDGKEAGEGQMQQSADLMNAGKIDLMQVHNLRDLDVHMSTIRDWQAEKRIRYNGVTHYRASALDDLEAVMRSHKPEFIQINYSLGEREADKRVLPLALDLGIAVLVNRPYMTGRLFRAVSGQDLPDWASEFAGSWGQFFLKYIVSHPATTCVIPATSKPHHMADNLEAGFGPLPDESTRQKMVELIDRLS